MIRFRAPSGYDFRWGRWDWVVFSSHPTAHRQPHNVLAGGSSLSISVACDQCHSRFKAPDAARGKQGACPKCGARLQIGEPASDATDRGAVIRISCPGCSAAYRVPAKFGGKSCHCKKCGTSIPIPAEPATSTAEPDQPPETVPHDSPPCPKCNQNLRVVKKGGEPTGETLCVACKSVPGICPFCDGQLRTDKAQQCYHCGRGWHATGPPNRAAKVRPSVAAAAVQAKSSSEATPAASSSVPPIVQSLLFWVAGFFVMVIVGGLGGCSAQLRFGDDIRMIDPVTIGQGLMTSCVGSLGAVGGCFLALAGKNIGSRIGLGICGFIGGYILGLLAGALFVAVMSGFTPPGKPELGQDIGEAVLKGEMGLIEAGASAGAAMWGLFVVMSLISWWQRLKHR